MLPGQPLLHLHEDSPPLSEREKEYEEVLKVMWMPSLRNIPAGENRGAVTFARITGEAAASQRDRRAYAVLHLFKAEDNAFYPVWVHAHLWHDGAAVQNVDWFCNIQDNVESMAEIRISVLRLLISILNGQLVPLGFRINACEMVTNRTRNKDHEITEFESKIVKFTIRKEPWEFGSQIVKSIGIYEMNQNLIPWPR
jgi:hypothetical protein